MTARATWETILLLALLGLLAYCGLTADRVDRLQERIVRLEAAVDLATFDEAYADLLLRDRGELSELTP